MTCAILYIYNYSFSGNHLKSPHQTQKDIIDIASASIARTRWPWSREMWFDFFDWAGQLSEILIMEPVCI